MVAAEGGGIAIATAIANNITPHEVAESSDLMADIQSRTGLADQIDSRSIRNLQREIVDQDYIEPVSELLSWGLIVGGYDNNFRLEETLAERTFVYLILNGLKNRDARVEYPDLSSHLAAISSTEKPIQYDKVQEITSLIGDYALELDSEEFLSVLENWQIKRNIGDGIDLKRGQVYHLATDILNQFELSDKLKLYRDK